MIALGVERTWLRNTFLAQAAGLGEAVKDGSTESHLLAKRFLERTA